MLRVRKRRWPAVCVLLSGIGVLGLLWFNLLYYPGIGLDGIDRDDSGAALTGAAKAFASPSPCFSDRLLDSDQLTKPDGGIVAGRRSRSGPGMTGARAWSRCNGLTWGWIDMRAICLRTPATGFFFPESTGNRGMNKVRYVLRRCGLRNCAGFREVHRVLL